MVSFQLARDDIDDVESDDKEGRTALSWATASRIPWETGNLLLARGGVDATSKDKAGLPPTYYARKTHVCKDRQSLRKAD